MRHLYAGAGLEQLNRIVHQPPHTAGCVVQYSRVGLGVYDQFYDRLHGNGWVDYNRLWDSADDTDRAEALQRVVADLLGNGCYRHRADAADAERVPVRRRPGHEVRTNDATRAGPIFNHYRLTKRLLDIASSDSTDKVSVAAR